MDGCGGVRENSPPNLCLTLRISDQPPSTLEGRWRLFKNSLQNIFGAKICTHLDVLRSTSHPMAPPLITPGQDIYGGGPLNGLLFILTSRSVQDVILIACLEASKKRFGGPRSRRLARENGGFYKKLTCYSTRRYSDNQMDSRAFGLPWYFSQRSPRLIVQVATENEKCNTHKSWIHFE